MNTFRSIVSIFCTLLAIWLMGCNSNTEKISYRQIKSVSFSLTYAPEGKNILYLKDSLYFYTYNYNTFKRLDIFNEQGKNIHTISLKNLDLPYGVWNIQVKNIDSIFVLSKETNLLYLINHKSEIKRRIRLDSLIKRKTDLVSPFTVYSVPLVNMLKGKDIVLYLNVSKVVDDKLSIFEQQIEYNKHYISQPYFIAIKNFLDTNYSVCIDNPPIRSKIQKQTEYYPVGLAPTIIGDTVFFSANCKDSLFLYSYKTGEYLNAIPIQSEYTQLKYPLPAITEQNIYKLFSNKGLSRQGMILNIEYETQKGFYCVPLMHEETGYKKDKEYFDYADINVRKFSVILYDRKWNKIQEVFLPEDSRDFKALPNSQFMMYLKAKNPKNITLNIYEWR